MKTIKDLAILILFIGVIVGSMYISMISLDEHIAIENAKELEYQHYIYKESLK